MKEWSLISCSLISSGIIGENLYLLNWQIRFQKALNKRLPLMWPMCIREKHLFHNDTPPILNSYHPRKG